MLKIIIHTLLILSTQIALAENRSVFQVPEGTKIVIDYPSQGKWILEEFLVRPGQLQEKVLTHTFTTQNELYRFKNISYLDQIKTLNEENYIATEVENKSLWNVTSEWDLEWEEKYELWLKADFDKDFFHKYNLRTDCADVAFALRWIFARVNGLPAANTLAGTNIVFSHESMKKEWEHLPTSNLWYKDERFISALNYLLSNAYTGTLYVDTYPLEINKNSFKIGTIWLTGDHTMIISKIDYTGKSAPIRKLSSTVPAEVRVLSDEIMIDSSGVDKEDGGLVRMRWPQKVNGTWSLIPKKQMPFFSMEQYEPDFMGQETNFTMAIIKRLEIPFSPSKVILEAAKSLTTKIVDRIEIVRNGYNFCTQHECPEGSFNYEEYSTPSRDERIYGEFKTIDGLVKKWKRLNRKLPEVWNDFLKNTNLTVENTERSLAEYKNIFNLKLLSYHPEDSIEERWAVGKKATFSAFRKKTYRLLKKRQVQVKGAKICEKNIDCLRETDLWKQHNTYAIDAKLKYESYYVYQFLLDKYGHEEMENVVSDSLLEEIYKIPSYISEPIADMERKLGKHNQDLIHLGNAKVVVELSPGIALVNDRIVKLSPYKVLRENISGQLLLDDITDKLITLDNDIISLYHGENGELLTRIKLTIKSKGFGWFGKSIFYNHNCVSIDLEENRNPNNSGENNECKIEFYRLGASEVVKIEEFTILPHMSWNLGGDEKLMSKINGGTLALIGNPIKLYYGHDGDLKFLEMKASEFPIRLNYSKSHISWTASQLDSEEDTTYFLDRASGQVCHAKELGEMSAGKVYQGKYFIALGEDDNERDTSFLYSIEKDCRFEKLRFYPNTWAHIQEYEDFLIVNYEGIDTLHNGKLTEVFSDKSLTLLNVYGTEVVYGKFRSSTRGPESLKAFDVVTETYRDMNPYYLQVNCNGWPYSGAKFCATKHIYGETYFKVSAGRYNFFQTFLDDKKQEIFSEYLSWQISNEEEVEEIFDTKSTSFYYLKSGLIFRPGGEAVVAKLQ